MKAVIPGANVKIFGRAVHSLSRIGDELYIEPLDHGLSLRTVNSSRSAYACFVFAPSFFLHYDGAPKGSEASNVEDDDDDDGLRCKIGMKSCVNVFKSLSTLEKTVDKCKITINMAEARLVFQLYCRHGIVKTHNLAFIESETLQAVFSKDLTPNILTAQSRLLCETVMNFQTNQEEISLIVNPEEVCVKNYIDDQPDVSKAIRTQMRLSPDEFESFQVGVDTEVTFCLRELRAILGFSESANLPISIHFESPGKPIVFCLDSDPSFEANFVLATLADVSTQVSCSQQSTQFGRSAYKNRSSSNVTNSSQRSVTKKRRSSEEHTSFCKRHEMEPEINGRGLIQTEGQSGLIQTEGQSGLIQSEGQSGLIQSEGQSVETNSRREKIANAIQLQATLDNLVNDQNVNDVTLPTPNLNPQARGAHNDEEDDSPVLPLQSDQCAAGPIEHSGYLAAEDVESGEEEVPGTPPKATQFKSLFFGLSQASASTSQPQRLEIETTEQPMVLAEDTDEED